MAFGVRANPEDMERFASELQYFNNQLAESVARVNAQFAGLGETWLDPEHERYAAEFQQTMHMLREFMKSTDDQIPFLRRKAQRLRDFIDQR